MKKILLTTCCLFFMAFITVAQEAKTYAVLVVITKYKDTIPSGVYFNNFPAYMKADVDSVETFLKSAQGNYTPVQNIKVLRDEEATHENIIGAMEEYFAKATEKDRIVFYFSGHGIEGAFSTHDINGEPDAGGKAIFTNALTHDEVKAAFKKSKAGMKICFADACHAGTIIEKKATGSQNYTFEKGAKDITFVNKTLLIMLASRGSETSETLSALQRSVFTFVLMQGLYGKADLNTDKKVTIKELYSYVRGRVRAFTKGNQTPVAYGQFDPNAVLVTLK